MNPELPSIDTASFWRALGVRAAGGAIVAARSAQGPAGFLALSVTHLTQSPPSLLVSIGKSTSALGTILEAGTFAVSYLSTDQAALVEVFSGRSPSKGADRFEPADWTELATGAPVLRHCVGALDCVLVETIERFETVIAIGRIVANTAAPDGQPLVFFKGGIRSLTS